MADTPLLSNSPKVFPVFVGSTLPAPWFAASAFALPDTLEFSFRESSPAPKKSIRFAPTVLAPLINPPFCIKSKRLVITLPPFCRRDSLPESSPFSAPGHTCEKISFTALDGLLTFSASLKLSRNASAPSTAGSFRLSKPSNPSSAPYHAWDQTSFVSASSPAKPAMNPSIPLFAWRLMFPERSACAIAAIILAEPSAPASSSICFMLSDDDPIVFNAVPIDSAVPSITDCSSVARPLSCADRIPKSVLPVVSACLRAASEDASKVVSMPLWICESALLIVSVFPDIDASSNVL